MLQASAKNKIEQIWLDVEELNEKVTLLGL